MAELSGNSGMPSNGTTSNVGRKHQITILDKLRVLERIDNGESGHEIAKELGVGRSTITYWKHQRKKLEDYVHEKGFQGMRALKLSRVAGDIHTNGRAAPEMVPINTGQLRNQMEYFHHGMGASHWNMPNRVDNQSQHQRMEEQNGDNGTMDHYGARYDESTEHYPPIEENSDDERSILECKLEIDEGMEEQSDSRELSSAPATRSQASTENNHHSREVVPPPPMPKVIVANSSSSSRMMRSTPSTRSSESVSVGDPSYELDYHSLTSHTDGIRLLTNALSYCQKFPDFSGDDLMFFTKWIKLAADKSVEDTLRQASTSHHHGQA